MPHRIIDENVGYPVKPGDINIDPDKGFQKFWEAFDNSETETSAFYVVKLSQQLGGWFAFTHEQIEACYQTSGHKGFRFNRLVNPEMVATNAAAVFAGDIPVLKPVGGGWIIKGDDGKYRVTDDFIERCHKSSLS